MIQTIRNAWKIPELRKKLTFVLFAIVVYRFGHAIYVPFVDSAAQHLERVSVSAGVRGCQVILAVDALVACTKAKFADLCRG